MMSKKAKSDHSSSITNMEPGKNKDKQNVNVFNVEH